MTTHDSSDFAAQPYQPAPGQRDLFADLGEAQALPARRTRQADDTFLLDDPRSLMSALERDFFRVNLKVKSPKTRADYRSLTRGFCRWFFPLFGRLPRPEDLSDELLAAYAHDTLASGRVCADKVNTHLACLRRLSRVLCKRPLDGTKVPTLTKDVRTWNDAQVQAIVAQAGAQSGRLGPHAACDWWEALVLVILSTAGRVGAVLAVRTADVDLPRALIKLPAENQKHRKDETKRLLPEAIEPLRRILESPAELLFAGCPHGRSWIEDRYEALLIAAGLPAGRKEKFHNLRRYVATREYIRLLPELGPAGALARVQGVLGHSSPEVTRRYIDFSQVPDQVVSVVDSLPRFTTRQGPRIFRAS